MWEFPYFSLKSMKQEDLYWKNKVTSSVSPILMTNEFGRGRIPNQWSSLLVLTWRPPTWSWSNMVSVCGSEWLPSPRHRSGRGQGGYRLALIIVLSFSCKKCLLKKSGTSPKPWAIISSMVIPSSSIAFMYLLIELLFFFLGSNKKHHFNVKIYIN